MYTLWLIDYAVLLEIFAVMEKQYCQIYMREILFVSEIYPHSYARGGILLGDLIMLTEGTPELAHWQHELLN